MAWCVVKDNLENKDVLVVGPSSTPLQAHEIIHTGTKFRMYDDDNELYYEGYSTEEDFSPLDDYGMPNAGCTSIEYLIHEKWVRI